ncbi:hypothetical protein B0I27_10783 [Arcticibacter pallidicorallinus]|uniref:PD-(D/E)XK nuclease superfamily protein n=1 Tax=Arcticibacter pallidicorallinus TaxID=1259464 RepID=A0A2T0U0X8_9SPHI|nr:HNH endonuclease [Arcticibacter pallidicorallinus]PRY51498.1 hypothetical protein B0I27_10783 [Arcticibacter pallidicorallinus]
MKNQQLQPKYKFYATLLDAFHYYLHSEAEDAFAEFINKINRVPFSSEKAEKGTAFNDLVDLVAAGKLSDAINDGLVVPQVVRKVEVYTYKHKDRQGNPWSFDFKQHLVHQFAARYENAVPQLLTEGYFETSKGTVLLYGYIDELEGDVVSDIKTTTKYEFPKFLYNYQHIVYPFTLNQQGIPVTQFVYDVTDFNNTYREDYIYNPERDLKRLHSHVVHLIDFLEINRHLITDKKVFAMDIEEEEPVPVPEPVE